MKPLKNDFLVTYLDIIDERLLKYLDEEDQLSLDTVMGLQEWAVTLLDGSITPASLRLEWPDWFQLASAFVFAYGNGDLGELEYAAVFLRAVEDEENVSLTDADRAYLEALASQLDMYPEMRSTTGEQSNPARSSPCPSRRSSRTERSGWRSCSCCTSPSSTAGRPQR